MEKQKRKLGSDRDEISSPSKKKKRNLLDSIQEPVKNYSSSEVNTSKKKKKKKKRHSENEKGDLSLNVSNEVNTASEDHDSVFSDERRSPKKKKQSTEVAKPVEDNIVEDTAKKKKKKKKKHAESTSDSEKDTKRDVAKDTDVNKEQPAKKEQTADWNQETTQNLCNFFLTLPVHSDEGLCQSTPVTDIQWDKIQVEGLTSEECHQRWNALYNIARRRMTIGEVMPLIHKVIDDPVVRRHHGIFAAKKKKSKRKTVTPQQLYVNEMVEKALQQNPKANRKEKAEHYRQKWSSLNDGQKIKWIDKALENEKASNDHPKVVVTKAEWKLKKKADGIPDPPPGSAYSLFCKKTLPKLADLKSNEKFTVLGARWKALSDKEKEQYREELSELREEYRKQFAEYLAGLPEEERKEAEKKSRKKSVPRTPSKATVLTREIYSEIVKPGLQRQHPAMSEKDLIRKISKDFLNLSAEEKSKYLEMYKKESADQKRITDFFNGKESPSPSESVPKMKSSPKKLKSPSPKKQPTQGNKAVVNVDDSSDSSSSSSDESSSSSSEDESS